MAAINASQIRLGLFVVGLLLFLVFELARPYRPATVSKAGRWLVNLGLTAFNSAFLYLVFGGAVIGTAQYTAQARIGVLNLVAWPHWMKILFTLVFMDFMLYVWHFLNHEMPLLWRFHRVHHSDPNMDVSTASRFHPGELAVSSVIKIGLIFFLGADLWGVVVFETALVLAAQFHHSSLKVPAWFERIYWIIFVPPSMHRIHHSVVIKERDANYGTVFSLWDRVMGTMIDRADQDRIRIGLGAYQDHQKLGFGRLLAMPFTRPVK